MRGDFLRKEDQKKEAPSSPLLEAPPRPTRTGREGLSQQLHCRAAMCFPGRGIKRSHFPWQSFPRSELSCRGPCAAGGERSPRSTARGRGHLLRGRAEAKPHPAGGWGEGGAGRGRCCRQRPAHLRPGAGGSAVGRDCLPVGPSAAGGGARARARRHPPQRQLPGLHGEAGPSAAHRGGGLPPQERLPGEGARVPVVSGLSLPLPALPRVTFPALSSACPTASPSLGRGGPPAVPREGLSPCGRGRA